MTSDIGDYYIGLDIGTSSVGWAVTDEKYNILEYRRKAMWGIHLFEEGNTAAERRTHRCTRRRYVRRKQRLTLLRELLSEEICKVDPGFYSRLDESGLHLNDRKDSQPNSIFNDISFKDKDYHERYPTIYHLRKDLMYTDVKPDIRLVYLALAHIIKYRGHFLFETSTDMDLPSFDDVMGELINDLRKYGMELNIQDMEEVAKLVSDRGMKRTDKKARLYVALGCEDKNEKAVADLLSGSKTKLDVLFQSEEFSKMTIGFSESNVDEDLSQMEDMDLDVFNTLRIAKQVYDWGVLESLMRGYDSLSEAQVMSYEQHRSDLALLKGAIHRYNPGTYKMMFKSRDKVGNYCSYEGICGRSRPEKTCDKLDFYKFCRSILANTQAMDDPLLADMFLRMDNGSFMPKQSSRDNAVYPYTVHKKELVRILRNMARFYPFLNEVGDDGFTVSEKILKLQQFRIPYFVGPLDTRSERSWVVRKSMQHVTPWNYSDIIDEDSSAQGFMDKLTNMCTYMVGEKVLPKHSILYSRFSLYNELNNVMVNGEKLPPEIKNRIVEDLFLDNGNKRVTEKSLRDQLIAMGVVDRRDTIDITGMDKTIKTVLTSENSLRRIIGDKVLDRKLSESIIMTITVFGDREHIASKLYRDHSDVLTKDEIESLSRLRFEGWGRLSSRFLMELYDNCSELGMELNIMGLLEHTQDNLMQIMSKYSFERQIDTINRDLTTDSIITYDTIKRMPLSPSVKRAVWRMVRIVKEIVEKIGHDPKKIFIETTRSTGEKKATTSRKDNLLDLYRSCKEDVSWTDSLSSRSESELKSRSLYLYYTQLGRCMYCGRTLDIEDLNNPELVDRDHIYPQAVTKDDSVHRNMVLCCKTCNLTSAVAPYKRTYVHA